ncbi:response regulator [Halomontanus rarus]|uniref:response regulator n=1 Tax=Halomontanus rarus TaxID=3034020 RepID=UPI0023E8E080|nr:response regulator [Halovivax sp. TS33]
MIDQPSVEALLIDPNPEDVQRFLTAFENETLANNVTTVSNGTEALEFLNQRGEYADRARPNLVLLDIDQPEMDWRAFLETLDRDSELAGIPVIVLTESDDSDVIVQAYERHANGYVKKSADSDEFSAVVRSIEEFWFTVVWLPPRNEAEDEYR